MTETITPQDEHGAVVAVHEAPSAASTALAEMREWAGQIASSALVPAAFRGKPADLYLAAQYADAVGVPRVTLLTDMYVVEGKPTFSSKFMVTLARRAGHKVRTTIRPDGMAVRVDVIRQDDPEHVVSITWDQERAKTAGLWGKRGPWQTYPTAMLRSRAESEAIRTACYEVLAGVAYTPEEMDAGRDHEGRLIHRGHRVVSAAPSSAFDADEPAGEPIPVEAEVIA